MTHAAASHAIRGVVVCNIRSERGVGGKSDKVREVAWIYSVYNLLNADKGDEGSETQKFADVV